MKFLLLSTALLASVLLVACGNRHHYGPNNLNLCDTPFNFSFDRDEELVLIKGRVGEIQNQSISSRLTGVFDKNFSLNLPFPHLKQGDRFRFTLHLYPVGYVLFVNHKLIVNDTKTPIVDVLVLNFDGPVDIAQFQISMDRLNCHCESNTSSSVLPTTESPTTVSTSTGTAGSESTSTGTAGSDSTSTEAASTTAASSVSTSTEAASTESTSTTAASSVSTSTEAASTESTSTTAASSVSTITEAASTESTNTVSTSSDSTSTESTTTQATTTTSARSVPKTKRCKVPFYNKFDSLANKTLAILIVRHDFSNSSRIAFGDKKSGSGIVVTLAYSENTYYVTPFTKGKLDHRSEFSYHTFGKHVFVTLQTNKDSSLLLIDGTARKNLPEQVFNHVRIDGDIHLESILLDERPVCRSCKRRL